MVRKIEGYLRVKGGRIWYSIVGERGDIPIILIHGGPGYPHNYLKPLEDLADKREVIFYDQLGCGNSDRSSDGSFWTIESFVNELEQLVKQLGLSKYHILGQSWGAVIAVSFALKRPKGLKSIILSDPYLSTPLWERDANTLIGQLPEDMQMAINGYEKDGKTTAAFKKASTEFYKRYVFGMSRTPKPVRDSRKGMNLKMYNHMWGSEEYWVTGTLKDLDLTKNLKRIKLPVLLLCGLYDEASPTSLKHFKRLLPDAKIKIFSKSAHYPFWTDRKTYMKSVEKFLESG